MAESNSQCLLSSSRCFYPARFYLEPKVYLPIAGSILRPAVDAVEVEMYIAVEIRFPNGDPKSLSQMRFRGPDADDLMLEDANPP